MREVLCGQVDCLEVSIEGRLKPLRLGPGRVTVVDPTRPCIDVVTVDVLARQFAGLSASFEFCAREGAELMRGLRLYGGRTTYRRWGTKQAQRLARKRRSRGRA